MTNTPSPQAVRLLPDGDPCTLRDCPPGPFLFNGHVGFKTEYRAMEPDGPTNVPGSDMRWKVGTRPDAYVLDSGEYFWGGTSTHGSREMLIVQPLAASPALAAETGGEAVAPRGEVTDEWADRFCEAVNWSPDGQECKVVEGEMRCATFRQIAKGHILAAIATGPEALAALTATEAKPEGEG